MNTIREELEAIEDWAAREERAFELVQAHGALAASATVGGGTCFDLDGAPEGSPWSAESRDPEAIVKAVFAPIAERVPTLVRALVECVVQVLGWQTADGQWRLLYYLERTRPEAMCTKFPGGSNRHVVYMGGPPNDAPHLGEEAVAAGWGEVPPELAVFASVHDGFGPRTSTFGVECVLPLAAMAPLNERRPEWLEVRCDSVGNRRVLLRDFVHASATADWDHETHEVTDRLGVLAWLDRDLAFEVLDLDRYDFPRGPFATEVVASPPWVGDPERFEGLPFHEDAKTGCGFGYAVDFEAWRGPDRERFASVVRGATTGPVRRYLDEILTMTTTGRIETALQHIVDPGYEATEDTDDCAHSWTLEALCLGSGRCLDFQPSWDLLEALDETHKCLPTDEGLPFGLPRSHTKTPYVGHANAERLGRHLLELDALLESGALAEVEDAAREYRAILQALVDRGLGLIEIGW